MLGTIYVSLTAIGLRNVGSSPDCIKCFASLWARIPFNKSSQVLPSFPRLAKKLGRSSRLGMSLKEPTPINDQLYPEECQLGRF